jgi:hypothetical protein
MDKFSVRFNLNNENEYGFFQQATIQVPSYEKYLGIEQFSFLSWPDLSTAM